MIASASGIARGIVSRGLAHLLAERRDPRVPGEREEEQAGRLQHAVDAAVREHATDVRRGRVAAERDRADDDGERDERRSDEHTREPRRPRDAAQVRAREHGDGAERGRPAPPLRPGNDVRAERDRHRRTRRGLADDEPEAGDEPPPLPETLTAVDVRAARRRILRRELRRRDRVAVRDARGEQEADEQAAARRRRGRRERREDARADHRAEPDDDRVGGAEAPGERAAQGHIAAATCRAASASSSSETFGSTSSQSGSIIPDASTIPSGRGMNHTWKCAPPSPQR